MKIKVINIFKHFKKICIHKYWVFYHCCKMGIPIQGLLHDLSKFSLVEFWEGVRYYQGTFSPIDACKKENGWSPAWMHHKGRNKHHYEYWMDNLDDGGTPLEMPLKYKKEMLCDYLGAGRAYYGKDFTYEKEYEWWQNKLSKPLAMHDSNKDFISMYMELLKVYGDNAFKIDVNHKEDK